MPRLTPLVVRNDGVSPSSTYAQFVAGPLAAPATVPPMPWKSDTTKGHLMGTLANAAGVKFDGATVTISGAVNRTLQTDATGFFGVVDLPAGSYTITVSLPGYVPVTRVVTVTGTLVTQSNITLLVPNPLRFEITSNSWNRPLRRMTLTWNSRAGETYRVEISSNMNLNSWTPIGSGIASAGTSTTWTSATLPLAARHFFRVIVE